MSPDRTFAKGDQTSIAPSGRLILKRNPVSYVSSAAELRMNDRAPRVELRLIFFSLLKFILTLPCKVVPLRGRTSGKMDCHARFSNGLCTRDRCGFWYFLLARKLRFERFNVGVEVRAGG